MTTHWVPEENEFLAVFQDVGQGPMKFIGIEHQMVPAQSTDECAECSGIGDACTCDEAVAQMYEGRA